MISYSYCPLRASIVATDGKRESVVSLVTARKALADLANAPGQHAAEMRAQLKAALP